MNTEHTNQPRQAANAAFEQWWQRHGLEDPMDDEDRYYITASSWARRGYLAAMGLATIKDSLPVAQQAALIENLKVLAKSFGHKVGCAKNAFGEQCTCGADEAIAAAEQVTLCASCARADVNCPIYPQQTASCVEHRPAAQQQAEPVAWMMFDRHGTRTGWTSEKEYTRHAFRSVPLYAQPPAVAVPGAKQNIGMLPVKDRYFLCRCEKCGWLGSSEECRESINHMYGDGDYYCPACGANGPDEMYEAEATFNAMLAAAPQAAPLSAALADIAAERRRQIEAEGWTPEHDDKYRPYVLSAAAGCYAMHTLAYPAGDPPSPWPFAASWWKPSADTRRNLVKAGALIAAEIERLDRAAQKGDA